MKIPSFEIVRHPKYPLTGIKCLVCGRTSYNQGDVENYYCGFCHVFHEDEPAEKQNELPENPPMP